ncbi:MAG TPA: radical SAM protein [Pyrinomonadaceae bacterium]|nr:radical SAM protein [Pyrinomonadaceae bacterium]
MKVLLLAGLGPYFKQSTDLVGSLFEPGGADRFARPSPDGAHAGFDLRSLAFEGPDGRRHQLLRRERSGSLSLIVDDQPAVERAPIPNLSAATVLSILDHAGVDYEYLPLDAVWDGEGEPSAGAFDCVLLSTTFICDRVSLARAVNWIAARLPGTPVVVGGQFSNLKYEKILRDHPEVLAVVRGDGELALPLLLRALEGRHDFDAVPNLVMRSGSGAACCGSQALQYVDIETHPAPTFRGPTPIVPYESMRGCPFTCKFCSFPAASPKWRYKSAQRIVSDWVNYREVNGARHIRALDSTFTVPQTRFRELLALLPAAGIGWEAFTRANVLSNPAVIESLARAHCRTLSIGFESMSDNSLDYMDKKVSAKQNRTAFRLLRGSPVGYRMSFMAGYPGETPEDYRETHDFLVDEYEGHFTLSVFSLQDETMPVWEDAQRFNILVADPENPDYSWTHSGMDVRTARALRQQTLRDVRWKNDGAVPFLWQTDYQTPLMPHRTARENYRAEKLVERIGFLPTDYPDPEQNGPRLRSLLAELAALGVTATPAPAPARVG